MHARHSLLTWPGHGRLERNASLTANLLLVPRSPPVPRKPLLAQPDGRTTTAQGQTWAQPHTHPRSAAAALPGVGTS
eukprot:356609-Chlamydomonas_euryale.AAC.1